MLKPIYDARSDSGWVSYAAIVRRESSAFDEKRALFRAACAARDDEKIWPLMEAVRESGSIAIVFSALTLEAMIYDFAASYLGDTYVEEHLDRLDPPSKWIVFARLVCGSDFPKDHHSFGLLTKTFRARNEIVHAKSAGLRRIGERMDQKKHGKIVDKFYAEFPEHVSIARKAIDEVPGKLYELTGQTMLLAHFPKDERERWFKRHPKPH